MTRHEQHILDIIQVAGGRCLPRQLVFEFDIKSLQYALQGFDTPFVTRAGPPVPPSTTKLDLHLAVFKGGIREAGSAQGMLRPSSVGGRCLLMEKILQLQKEAKLCTL